MLSCQVICGVPKPYLRFQLIGSVGLEARPITNILHVEFELDKCAVRRLGNTKEYNSGLGISSTYQGRLGCFKKAKPFRVVPARYIKDKTA